MTRISAVVNKLCENKHDIDLWEMMRQGPGFHFTDMHVISNHQNSENI